MKIFDVHSHWGTERGYPLRTKEALALQKKNWNSETSYHTEDEMAAYFVKITCALSRFRFHQEARDREVVPYHDYAIETQRKYSDVIHGFWRRSTRVPVGRRGRAQALHESKQRLCELLRSRRRYGLSRE
jgi:hypothetical protein